MVRDFSFDESISNGKKEEVDNNKKYEEKQKEVGIYMAGWSVFDLELENYLAQQEKLTLSQSKNVNVVKYLS